MTKLDGKAALVSGSGRGIGRAIALKLAAEGARLVVNDLDEGPAAETVAAIIAAGGAAVACNGDVTADGFPERFVATALDAYGAIDIIVNNAGYTWDSVIQKTSDAQWQAMIDVHLTAPFKIMRAASEFIRGAAKEEIAQGRLVHRKVVNISSISGLYGNAGQVSYGAAKAGLVGLTRSMCKEWGRYNVNVNCVAFALIESRLTQPLDGEAAEIDVAGRAVRVGIQRDRLEALNATIPLGRAGTPEDAAGAVYLMCTLESDYISGQVLVVGGGLLM